jgi:hypothetical protein
VFRLYCHYITTNQRGSLWAGQDKRVCRRPLGARHMARAIFGAEAVGDTVASGEPAVTGRGALPVIRAIVGSGEVRRFAGCGGEGGDNSLSPIAPRTLTFDGRVQWESE